MIHININGNMHFYVKELTSLTVTEDEAVVTVEKKVNDGCLVDNACGKEECEKTCPDCEWYDTCLAYSQEEDEEAPYVDGDIAAALEIAGRQFNEAFGKCNDCMCDNECIECPLTNAQRMNTVCPAEEGLVCVKSPDDLDCLCAGDCDNCAIDTYDDPGCEGCCFNPKCEPEIVEEPRKSVMSDDALTNHRCWDCDCRLPKCSRECLESEETGCMSPDYGKPVIDTPAEPLYECGGRCEAEEHGPFDGCYGYYDNGWSVEYKFVPCTTCPNKPKDTGAHCETIEAPSFTDVLKEWKAEALRQKEELTKLNGEVSPDFSNMFLAFIKGMRDGLAKYMKNNEKQSDDYTYGE